MLGLVQAGAVSTPYSSVDAWATVHGAGGGGAGALICVVAKCLTFGVLGRVLGREAEA